MSNKSKHTPGPWTTEWNNEKVRIIGPKRRAIAETITSIEADNESNARLIAEAPKLLQALKVALELAETGLTKYPQGISNDAELYAWLKSVISKAEGRE